MTGRPRARLPHGGQELRWAYWPKEFLESQSDLLASRGQVQGHEEAWSGQWGLVLCPRKPPPPPGCFREGLEPCSLRAAPPASSEVLAHHL